MHNEQIKKIIELVKENNQRNNAEIVGSLLALQIDLEQLKKDVEILKLGKETFQELYDMMTVNFCLYKTAIEQLNDNVKIINNFISMKEHAFDLRTTPHLEEVLKIEREGE